jgi:hypothetical protein
MIGVSVGDSVSVGVGMFVEGSEGITVVALTGVGNWVADAQPESNKVAATKM